MFAFSHYSALVAHPHQVGTGPLALKRTLQHNGTAFVPAAILPGRVSKEENCKGLGLQMLLNPSWGDVSVCITYNVMSS